MSLPTNYKDQILDDSMGGLRQYAMIKNANGTYSFRDVSRYVQVGTQLAANDINAISDTVNTLSDSAVTAESPVFTGIPLTTTPDENDSSSQIANTFFVNRAIAKALSGMVTPDVRIVASLPVTGEKGIIYLVADTTSSTQNVYIEYIWVEDINDYEIIGSTKVDLSGFVTLNGAEALTNKTYNGYTLGDACEKGVDSAVTSGSSNLVTSGAVSSAISGIPTSDTTVTHAANTAVGSATKGVYVDTDGSVKAMTYAVNKDVPSNAVFTDNNTTYSLTQDATDGHIITLTPSTGSPQSYTIPDNDTKNTAGSSNSTSKLFIIGATSQAANPQTFSRSTCYIGTDGCLYSNGAKVAAFTEVTGSLAAGSTSLTLSNSAITTSSTIDVYTGTFGVAPTGMTIAAGKVTLTFDKQSAALSVKIRIS